MWTKVREAIRWALKLEPVVVMTVVRAVLVVLVAAWALFGFELDTTTIEPKIAAFVGAVYLLAEALTAAWTRMRATPTAKVIEAAGDPRVLEEGGESVVVAGGASPKPDGTVLGSVYREDLRNGHGGE